MTSRDQPEPKPPPAWTHRILQTLKTVGGVGGMRVQNFDALFQGGVCPACGMARGPRTAEPLRYRHLSGQEVHYDGWMASGSPQGTIIQLFSESFIALLTDQERACLEWRPAVNTAYGKKTVFELAGSRWHLPLATLLGGAPYTPRCGLCGFAPPPRYSSVTTLPRWLNPDGDEHAWRGQPAHYVSAAEVPDPLPPCFTVGDWREWVSLVLPPERWAALLALGRAHRPRAIKAWDLAILPPELLDPAGIDP